MYFVVPTVNQAHGFEFGARCGRVCTGAASYTHASDKVTIFTRHVVGLDAAALERAGWGACTEYDRRLRVAKVYRDRQLTAERARGLTFLMKHLCALMSNKV